MKLLLVLLLVLSSSACTSMLLGATGQSAGSAIGEDNRDHAQKTADDAISRAIRSKVAADAELSQFGIRVETRDGNVTLRGTVASFSQRERILRLANDIRGVVRVNSQIGVNSN